MGIFGDIVVASVYRGMMDYANIEIKESKGPEIPFDCPACRAQEVHARTYVRRDILKAFGLIPVGYTRVTCVICQGCQKSYATHWTLEKVVSASRDQLRTHLLQRVGFITKSIIVIGLLLFFVPIVGFVCVMCGLIAVRKKRSPWRVVAVIAAVMSGLTSALLLLAALRGS